MSLVHELERELRPHFEGEFRLDPVSRRLYATDASIYEIEPLAVAVPRQPQDLQALVELCGRLGIPLTGRGGATSLAGQTVGATVQVDFSKYLDRILRFDPEARWVEVEPGILLSRLNQRLAEEGLMFAPDPATQEHACVGGVVGNNSSGMRSLVYGKTVDHVLDLTLLTTRGTLQLRELDGPSLDSRLAQEDFEGQCYRAVVNLVRNNAELILQRFPKILRRVSGYNLDALLEGLAAAGHQVPAWDGLKAPLARVPQGFSLAPLAVGSEGSLGLITRARLNLVEKPRARGLLVSHFNSLEEALRGNAAILELNPSASELLDRMVLNLARNQLEMRRLMDFLEGDPEAVVVSEFSGGDATEVEKALKKAAKHLKKLGYAHLSITEPAAMERVWRVRKAGLPLLLGLKGARKPVAFIEDTAVAPERLVEYVNRFDQVVRAEDTTAAYYAHASVGCLHIRPLLDLKIQEDVDKMARLSEKISDLVVEFGGSMSGEHGDGLARGRWNKKQFGEVVYELFREVKRTFDPEGLMNPGKVVDSPVLTESLRLGPGYASKLPELKLDWSREEGFDAAVELCNGAGVCRKLDRATMCPSFMVTREEEHTVRGRANLLRAALNGRLELKGLFDRRLREALDLCLGCKACKAECPSGVDMAKMKFEFMAGYYQRRRPRLRTELFARPDLINRVGCAAAPWSNWLARSPLAGVINFFMGVAPRRPLPHFARQTFWSWWKHRGGTRPGDRRVALFVDTFNGYNEPEVSIAAVKVLESMGYEVELANRVCCGRPAISKGFFDQAEKQAKENFRRLAPYVEEGIPVVGLEPSCILSMRDDYRDLLPGEDLGPLGRTCVTWEEFMSEQPLELVGECAPLLLHGHCHQKALVGTDPSHRLLGRLAQVEEVDSGCCGMAGSFGYEVEHYEISRQIGERRLFPAVRRAMAEGKTVVAAGTSCRQQIEHFTGCRALHPAELLARHLKEGCGE